MSVMYVATLDILTEKGGFAPQAARAIGEAIDLEIARSRASVATREDVSDCRRDMSEEMGALRAETDRNFSALRSELKDGMSALRAELQGDISGLRTELKDEMSALRAELKGDINGLRTELKEDIGTLRIELKEDMAILRTELNKDMSALRADSEVRGQTMKADLVRWVFVAIIGQSATLLSVIYFFFKFIK